MVQGMLRARASLPSRHPWPEEAKGTPQSAGHAHPPGRHGSILGVADATRATVAERSLRLCARLSRVSSSHGPGLIVARVNGRDHIGADRVRHSTYVGRPVAQIVHAQPGPKHLVIDRDCHVFDQRRSDDNNACAAMPAGGSQQSENPPRSERAADSCLREQDCEICGGEHRRRLHHSGRTARPPDRSGRQRPGGLADAPRRRGGMGRRRISQLGREWRAGRTPEDLQRPSRPRRSHRVSWLTTTRSASSAAKSTSCLTSSPARLH